MFSSTARAWLVRPSYSVGSTPQTSSPRLVNRRTSCTVSSSWPTPRCDSVSHCSGISTPSRRGQRRDREHAERRRAVQQHPVVAVARSSSAIFTTCSRPVRVSRSASARASSMVAGSRSTPSSVSTITSVGVQALGQHVVHRQLEVLGVDAQRERQAGLRVEVDEQHPAARARRARRRARRRWSSSRRHPSGWRPRGSWSWRRARAHHAASRVAVLATVRECWAACRDPLALVTGPDRPASACPSPAGSPRTGHDLVLVSRDPRAAGAARRRARASRTASRWRCWSPTSATATQLAAGRGPAGRPGAAGRPAGQQRRLRPQATRSSTTPSSDEQYLLDVLVTAVLRLTHAALGPMVRARQRRGRERVQRRRLPAARHLQRRQGLRHLAERVGRPDLPATAACG